MKFAELLSVNDHGLDLPVLVRPDEIILIAEGRLDGAPVCNILTRHGGGVTVYGSAEEVNQTLLSSQRLN